MIKKITFVNSIHIDHLEFKMELPASTRNNIPLFIALAAERGMTFKPIRIYTKWTKETNVRTDWGWYCKHTYYLYVYDLDGTKWVKHDSTKSRAFKH